ncbi:hypothetical protein JHK85_006624 [Glycine max]|nr:hypothetical protein JHK85_006624 [Glycine max]
MAMKKEARGIGFKYFHAFNIVMQVNKGWRLLTNQDTMVAKVFKAKYFLSVDFKNAHNPSFIDAPPRQSFLKYNFDATIFAEANAYGANIYLRGTHGNFIIEKIISSSGIPSLEEVETWAFSKAINWIR